ncbi:ParB family transcriptional regulator, chromosome partitioning protein [Azospirillaceae bacterium]
MPPKFQRNTRALVLGPAGREEASETDALFGLSGTLLRLIEADVDRIASNPEQPRTVFDNNSLEALAASIDKHGLQQPILVREGAEKGHYILVAGERRLRAHYILHRQTIPALITRGRPEEVALIENVQRVDLDAVDLARSLKRLIERHGYSQAEAGMVIGSTESEVSRRLSVLRLPPELLAEYRERAGEVSRSVLFELAALDDSEQQRALWARAKQGLSVRALRSEKKDAETRPPRHRPLSFKVLNQSLERVAELFERVQDIRRELRPEHRAQLRALRQRIDGLLGEGSV